MRLLTNMHSFSYEVRAFFVCHRWGPRSESDIRWHTDVQIRKICLLNKLGSLTSYWAAQLPEDPFKIIQVSPGLSELQGQFLQGQLQQAESEAVCV